jgi:acyl-CoA reductase-like NAD-dependent aldehyde dehydrogenase
MASALSSNASELAHLLTLEQGKPLKMAKSEISSALEAFKACMSIELPFQVLPPTHH